MINIEATDSTPFVRISIKDCIFEIKGSSYDDDTDSFYEPIIELIDKDMGNLECELNCEFYLHVFNSVTNKYLFIMMMKFVQYNKTGKKIKITWFYDKNDDENKESAEDISELFNIPFELKEISE